jgi:hypothetical protein
MTTIRIRRPISNVARTQRVPVRRGAAAALFVSAPLVGGFLTVPIPAQADPMLPLAPPRCVQFGFPGDVQLRQSNGWTVTFSSVGSVASGPAQATGASGGKMTGNISGGITGNKIDLTIRWDNGPRGRYSGFVGDDYHMSGDSVDKVNPSSTATYRSVFPISCLTTADPAPPQQPPPTPKATVTGDVDVYAAPNINDDLTPLGILKGGKQVELVGPCQPEDWCQVKGPDVPGGQGFIWGHLQLP